MGETLTREQIDRVERYWNSSDFITTENADALFAMARAYLDTTERNAWLLARNEELFDALNLEGPTRHPVDARLQVEIMRDDLTVADRRARRWEAFGRRIWARLDDAMLDLSGLSSYLGAGLGDHTTTAEQYHERIRWGIDHMLRVETGRREEAERDLATARRELGEVREVMRLAITTLDSAKRDIDIGQDDLATCEIDDAQNSLAAALKGTP